MKERIKKKLLTLDEISKISKVKIGVISVYVRQGILPHEKQDEGRLKRYYDKEKTLKRLKEIMRAEREGFTRKEIKEFFLREDLFSSLKDISKDGEDEIEK